MLQRALCPGLPQQAVPQHRHTALACLQMLLPLAGRPSQLQHLEAQQQQDKMSLSASICVHALPTAAALLGRQKHQACLR